MFDHRFAERKAVGHAAHAEECIESAGRRDGFDTVDLQAVGLDDLGKHEGYIARQLKRWYGQWNQQKTRELPAVDQVHDALLQRIPEQGPATIVHGDYRLDNCMIGADGHVMAVLDWEICTLGDPLADLGLLMVYWSEPGDPYAALPGAATTLEGFCTRAELVAEYEAAGGRLRSVRPEEFVVVANTGGGPVNLANITISVNNGATVSSLGSASSMAVTTWRTTAESSTTMTLMRPFSFMVACRLLSGWGAPDGPTHRLCLRQK